MPRPKVNLGVSRNLVLRSFFLISIYSTIKLIEVKVKVVGFNWSDILPILAIPLWWILDYLVIWPQEVDSNYQTSTEWNEQKKKIDEVLTKISHLEKTVDELSRLSKTT